jgi:small subunit ribosomal protein S2
MNGLPDVLFVIDVGFENIAIKEAVTLGIPVVGIVDTNNSTYGIDYVIPGNDDSMRAIQLYTKLAADAILDGKATIVAPAVEETEEEAPNKKAVKKVAVTKKVAVKSDSDESAGEEVDAEIEAIEKKAVPKKAAIKKAAPKKSSARMADDSEDSE